MRLSQIANKTQIAEGVAVRYNGRIIVGYRLMQKDNAWTIESKPMVKGERRWLTVHRAKPSDSLDEVIATLQLKMPNMSISKII